VTDSIPIAAGPAGAAGVGVLLVNTGTPAAPRTAAVRSFLRRFLSDPRVIELPRALWLPLLYGLVLPLRAPRSARKYRQIWDSEGSPLLLNTSKLRAAIERELIALRGNIRVEQAFLYSAPYVAESLAALRDAGVRRLIVLPLFPQASGSTTGAVYDQVGQALRRWRALPELRYIAGYHAEADYISALAASLADHWRLHGRGAHLLMSFHGIPQSYVARGDRYGDQCRQTAAQLAAALDLAPRDWSLSFQSRFGANRWLTPATDRSLRELPRRGIRAVTVLCPGFAADCLETLEEIALAGRDIFLQSGGERFDYVPALNGRSDHAGALARLVVRSTADWAVAAGAPSLRR
jgi:protoporphyrin/coproporphyrin ferrochelatase